MNIEGRLVVSLLAACVLSFYLVASASASPGDLDPAYGDSGVSALQNDFVRDLDVTSDGSVLIAGYEGVERLLPDGSHDESFGQGGIAISDLPGTPLAVAEAPDEGAYVVTTQSDDVGNTFDTFLRRLEPDGTIDPEFGTDGVAPLSSGGFRMTIAVDSEQRVVVGSASEIDRFLPDGTRDASWAPPGEIYSVFSLLIDSQGRIVVASSDTPNGFHLRRYEEDGTFDAGFGGDGIAFVAGNYFEAENDIDIAEDQAGRLLVATGITGNPSTGRLVRLLGSGEPDPSYTPVLGTGGALLEIDSKGRTLTTGVPAPPGPSLLAPSAVVRWYTPTGSLNSLLGLDGSTFIRPTSKLTFVSDMDLGAFAKTFVLLQEQEAPRATYVARLTGADGPNDVDADGYGDRADRCPIVASREHGGCPSFGDVRVKVDRRGRRLVGRVLGENKVCSYGIALQIYRKRKGPNDRAEVVVSNPRFRSDRLAAGRYLIKSRPSTATKVGFCEKARSRTVRIRG